MVWSGHLYFTHWEQANGGDQAYVTYVLLNRMSRMVRAWLLVSGKTTEMERCWVFHPKLPGLNGGVPGYTSLESLETSMHQYDAIRRESELLTLIDCTYWVAAFPVQAECLKVLSGLHQERCCTLIVWLILMARTCLTCWSSLLVKTFSHAQRDLYVLKSPGLPKICHQSDVKLFTVTKPMSTAVMTPRRQERCLCLVEPASA